MEISLNYTEYARYFNQNFAFVTFHYCYYIVAVLTILLLNFTLELKLI